MLWSMLSKEDERSRRINWQQVLLFKVDNILLVVLIYIYIYIYIYILLMHYTHYIYFHDSIYFTIL